MFTKNFSRKLISVAGIALVLVLAVQVVAFAVATEIDIDIRPGNPINPINPKSNGVFAVGVITDASFDALSLDPATIRIGVTGVEAAPVKVTTQDIGGDLDTDLRLHFKTKDTGVVCGTTSLTLTGSTYASEEVQGMDAIRTVACKK